MFNRSRSELTTFDELLTTLTIQNHNVFHFFKVLSTLSEAFSGAFLDNFLVAFSGALLGTFSGTFLDAFSIDFLGTFLGSGLGTLTFGDLGEPDAFPRLSSIV